MDVITKENGKKRPKQPRKISASYLENAALYYLQRYATTAANLRTVLVRKINRSCQFHKTEPAEFLPLVDPLVERYVKSGLVNDATYAENRANALRRQGLSRQAIHAKLSQKGLKAADIEAALASVDADSNHADSELAAAHALARRKKLGPYRNRPLKDPVKDARKEMAAMARAGYSFDIVKRVLNWTQDSEDGGDMES